MLEEPRTGGALARAVQPLGNTGVVGPALLAVYGLGRWRRDRALTNAVTEIGLSALTTGVEVLALKEASGRPRPSDPGRDSDDMRMFSGDQSFPSGHTAISFALAEAINRSSGSRWAPWITFPVAAAVGWSRMRDDEHWLSDVVAGAAIGDWTARKVHRFERTTSGARHVQFGLGLTGRGVMLHGVW